MRKSVVTVALGLAVTGVTLGRTAALQAHHAFAAEFDARKEVTLKGAVTIFVLASGAAWLNDFALDGLFCG